jgi:multidrug efflux pump subunit AcrA (membrane-fusion protein)
VEDVLVAEGDTITAGQPVIVLDTEAMQDKAQEIQEQILAQQIKHRHHQSGDDQHKRQNPGGRMGKEPGAG